MTVIVVTSILFVLMLPVIGKLRSRAQRVQCAGNLKSLQVATQLYIQEHGSWPQIRLEAQSEAGWTDLAGRWIEALKPHGPTSKTWICPTRQIKLGNPDFTSRDHQRVDYIPTPFDDKPTTPYDLGTPNRGRAIVPIPWFSEAGDFHGHGNLMIFADGSVIDLKTVAATPGK